MRAWGLIACWAVALGAGCNQLLGLDEPAGDDDGDDERDAQVSDGPADRDMDGVPDVDDVCPDASDPGQHDEDGDGLGDRCDLCPHLAQESDVDGDEDNVPDACDPYPTTSGGRLRWSGFHVAAELDEWRAGGGEGVVEWSNDEVTLTPLLDGEVRFLRGEDDSGRVSTRTRVIASLGLGAPNAGGTARRAVGAITNVSDSGLDLFLCQLETDLPITQVRLQEYRIASGVAAAIATSVTGDALPMSDVILELDLGADDEQTTTRGAFCQVRAGAASHALPRATVVDLPPGEAGLRTVGVPLRVRWVAIIDHP